MGSKGRDEVGSGGERQPAFIEKSRLGWAWHVGSGREQKLFQDHMLS